MQGTGQQNQQQNQSQQQSQYSPHSGSFGFTLTISGPGISPVTKSQGRQPGLNPQALQALVQKAIQDACHEVSMLTPVWNQEQQQGWQQQGQQQTLQGLQQGSQGQQGAFDTGLQAYAQRRTA